MQRPWSRVSRPGWLRPSLLCQHGSRSALRFTYHGHVPLPAASRSPDPGLSSDGDASLPRLAPPLAAIGEPRLGLAASVQARRAKPP
jgi:hypothetical protein